MNKESKINELIVSKPKDIKDGKWFFIDDLQNSSPQDGFDKIKAIFKKFDRLYEFLVKVISPVYDSGEINKFVKKEVSSDKICLNIGSGNSNLSPDIINVDFFPYGNVDVVADIAKLPFKDNSIDVVMNLAVLEHVPDPQTVVLEIYRVLKPGGKIFTFFPFIQGFHASPHDYSRVTREGMKVLHEDFKELKVMNGCGPTSGFLWVFQEWIAILLSFGSKKLHLILLILLMCLTFPLKYLDIFLKRHPAASNIDSGFCLEGKK